jgi:hypothetical protein
MKRIRSPLLYPPTRSLVRREEGAEAKSWELRRATAARRQYGLCDLFGAVFGHIGIDGAQDATLCKNKTMYVYNIYYVPNLH